MLIEFKMFQIILHFAESQRNYHLAALKVLDEHIPLLGNKWKTHVQKPVFGCDLDEHLRNSGRSIAHPIEICVITLYETGMEEEGVFRIAGGASKVRRFRVSLCLPFSSESDAAGWKLNFACYHFYRPPLMLIWLTSGLLWSCTMFTLSPESWNPICASCQTHCLALHSTTTGSLQSKVPTKKPV